MVRRLFSTPRSIVEAVLLTFLVGAFLAPGAGAALSVPRAQRVAINALLDKFIPDVVRGDDPAAGRSLVGRYVRVGSVQRYPAKGSRFHGWIGRSRPGTRSRPSRRRGGPRRSSDRTTSVARSPAPLTVRALIAVASAPGCWCFRLRPWAHWP